MKSGSSSCPDPTLTATAHEPHLVQLVNLCLALHICFIVCKYLEPGQGQNSRQMVDNSDPGQAACSVDPKTVHTKRSPHTKPCPLWGPGCTRYIWLQGVLPKSHSNLGCP